MRRTRVRIATELSVSENSRSNILRSCEFRKLLYVRIAKQPKKQKTIVRSMTSKTTALGGESDCRHVGFFLTVLLRSAFFVPRHSQL